MARDEQVISYNRIFFLSGFEFFHNGNIPIPRRGHIVIARRCAGFFSLLGSVGHI